MSLQVREQTLDIWRSLIDFSYRDGSWSWEDRQGSNSISDAEQLLCILYPATNIPVLRIDDPDETAPDVLWALHGLGNDLDALRVFTDVLLEYMERHRLPDGAPDFSAGSYLGSCEIDRTAITPEQLRLEVVDSYSMSITLCLSVLGYVQKLGTKTTSRRTAEKLGRLKDLTSRRLTGAMEGMLSSFSVHVFDIGSEPGDNLCAMVNQTNDSNDRVVGERLARSLKEIRSSLRSEIALTRGRSSVVEALENDRKLLECGWSWGPVQSSSLERDGNGSSVSCFAEDLPYLYFTGVALDGIEDLFSPRTQVLGLLDDHQQRMSSALQLRWRLCMNYWQRVATFGTGRWPIEDLPWRATDGVESDHFTLLVTSMMVQKLHVEKAGTSQAVRLGKVLQELAGRGLITRRPVAGDSAIGLHEPGTRVVLRGGAALGPELTWTITSFSTTLLKRTIQTASLVREAQDRDPLVTLGNEIWSHLLGRRLEERGGRGLWDDPRGVFDLKGRKWEAPSWYHTQRACECLVSAAASYTASSPVSAQLIRLANEFLAEAEHIFEQERLFGSWGGASGTTAPGTVAPVQAISATLDRARDLRNTRPGTAVTLLQGVLKELEVLARPRSRSLTEDAL
ncbi:MAG: hypothetical protein QG608_3526 [Actinomycetota bacterium]|nr:hypothetical protein [Actinomycetota bacterium]